MTPESPQRLLLLPTEIILKVLEGLDFRCLLLVKQTCSALQALIEGSVSLQYKIELAAAGMRNCPDEILSVVSRLETLRHHQKAWTDLTGIANFDVPQRIESLVHSRYATIVDRNGIIVHAYRGARATESVLCITRIPSRLRQVEFMRWYLRLELAIAGAPTVSIDPSQDLLLILTLENLHVPGGRKNPVIHIRSLLTGGIHPLGPASGTIKIETVFPFFYQFQICGDFIATAVSPSLSDLKNVSIWNWKSGTLLTDTVMIRGLSPSYAICCFLDQCHVLALATPIPMNQAFLHVYNFQTQHRCYFAFPDFPVSTRLMSTWLLPNHVHHPATSIPHHGPFSTDPDDHLVIIIMNVMVGASIEKYELCVPASRLLKMCLRADEDSVIPWSEWGFGGAHFAPPAPSVSPEYVSVFGMRTAHIKSEDGFKSLLVTDYHPRRVMLAAQDKNDCKYSIRTERIQSDGPGLKCIAKEVRLPAEWQGRIVSYSFCEDGLLGRMNVLENGEWTPIQRLLAF
ncbi:hypothetical protein BV25DRAFT_1833232 [Artomyces pyxidatus]|uniref:Uncharacterized protein n=1 Tax=Artomyces pyxidatus TaxID=48021 RepID=A0ACB8SFQ7_9AGAM|nr:hypothetical protein BV25DRAFT_1833232 [Artomyces pyxidatus]